MDADITLTADEAAALRAILAGLAVLGESGQAHDKRLVEVTERTWHDMFLVPAQRLRRVTTARLPAPAVTETALRATPGRWAFLDTETGDWIEVKPGVVFLAGTSDTEEET